MINEQRNITFSHDDKAGNNVVHLSNRNTGNSVDIKMYFQYFFRMACILQPECNFLHGYLRCHLPVEAVDIEVKITSIQGTHVFRRDRKPN